MKETEQSPGRGAGPGPRRLAAVLAAFALLWASLPEAWAAEPPATEAFFGFGAKEEATEEAARTLIPVGQAVGIKLFSDGVLVVGLSEIPTATGCAAAPARDCGLKEGDVITHINSAEVDTIEEVQTLLRDIGGEEMSIRAMRGAQQVQVTAKAVLCSDGEYKLGAWIRDSMAGIGTVTFYDPETGLFGALGHGISDTDTAQLMPLESGGVLSSTITGVQKGEAGAPGQLQGRFLGASDIGALYANTDSGVFGVLADPSCLTLGEALPVARRSEVTTGSATILSNVSGDQVAEYTVEICRVYPNSDTDTRDMMIRVTDARLLAATGGIVQGMSGSPILQNGKLVGAVTHVLVNDPTCGYAILAEDMLTAAGQEFPPQA